MPWPRWLVVGTMLAFVLPVGSASAGDGGVAVHDLIVDIDPGIGGRFGGRVDVTVRFRVVNTGAAAAQPTARIRVESQIGGGISSTPIQFPSIAAGEHVDVVRRIRSVLPFGSVRLTVTVRAGGRTTTAMASSAVIPWFLLLALVVVVGVLLAARRARRR